MTFVTSFMHTLIPLTHAFLQMSVLVAQADEQIDNIQQNAEQVDTDMEQGNVQVDKAIVSARRARKMRWACFLICLTAAIIVAIVLAIYFTSGSRKH
jgi:syntaxin 1B/2/3